MALVIKALQAMLMKLMTLKTFLSRRMFFGVLPVDVGIIQTRQEWSHMLDRDIGTFVNVISNILVLVCL